MTLASITNLRKMINYKSQEPLPKNGGEMRKKKSDLAEFLCRHRKITDSGCWEWTRCRDTKGYGQVCVDYKKWIVSRLAYKIWKGPLLPKLCILHRCDNPPCFNPDHLFIGTLSDNTRDAIRKGRFINVGRTMFGEAHHQAKLKTSDVLKIREAYQPNKVHAKTLAQFYGVSVHTIRAIISKRLWSHLP